MKSTVRFAAVAGTIFLLSSWTLAPAQEEAKTPTQPAPDKFADGNFKISSPFKPSPETMVKEGVPVGKIHQFTMKSADSKLYPGIKGAYSRSVQVYVPAQYVEGTEAPFIVAQDGPSYAKTTTKCLDNLIHEKRVPAMIGIFINNGGGDGQGSERGLEYDTVSGKYAEFIQTEVLPKIETDYKVKFTNDPNGRATMGGSSGAACAFTMAWFHPEWYHLVLSYSGTFVNQQSPKSQETPHGAWEYHENLIPKSDAKPLRIWMEVGSNDLRSNDAESTFHNWVMANNRMADVLKAKGYHYRYVFAEGAGHVDNGVRNQTTAEALEWLWHEYKAK